LFLSGRQFQWNNCASTSMQRDKLQALSIAIRAYEMKLELLSSATVVERAVNFVNRHRDLTQQNKEVVINDTLIPR
jgi:hypothetical protein